MAAGDGVIDLSAAADRRRELMQIATEIVEKRDAIAAFYALQRAWDRGRSDGINEAIAEAEAALAELGGAPAKAPRSPRPPVRRAKRAQTDDPRVMSLFETV